VAVVLHRPSHAFDRLLRAMGRFCVLTLARNLPERGLLAVSGPITLRAYRVPTGFMLPVVVAPADHDTGLGPNNLGANFKTSPFKTVGNGRRSQCSVPDVSDGAGKQLPSLTPIRHVIVTDFVAAP